MARVTYKIETVVKRQPYYKRLLNSSSHEIRQDKSFSSANWDTACNHEFSKAWGQMLQVGQQKHS